MIMSHIVIYGAGKMGRKSYLILKEQGYDTERIFFAVTRKIANEKCLFGKKIYELSDHLDDKEDALVLVSVNDNFREQMMENARQLGFSKVFYFKDYFSDVSFFKKDPKIDEKLLAEWYYYETEEHLDWNNLRTYNEKLQWLKLYDQIEKKRDLTDKYKVREYIKKKIGSQYLVPLLGNWKRSSQIEFDKLPKSFVLKCNHGSGWNIIIQDKTKADWKAICQQLDEWMDEDYCYKSGFELQYSGIERRIIAEELLNEEGHDLRDYKVFVFSGRAQLVQVDIERSTDHRRNLYTRDWQYISEGICYPMAPDVEVPKPKCLDELIGVAEELGKEFIHVRVDFYIVNDHIYFGEMTFSHGSGTEKFTSKDFALKMGSLINLPI